MLGSVLFICTSCGLFFAVCLAKLSSFLLPLPSPRSLPMLNMLPRGTWLLLLVAASLIKLAGCLTPAQWRSQSIYQVMTDRFARTDLSTTASCVTSEQIYCGGTWEGLISKLDYIQNMGFTAIWISPMVAQMSGDTSDGESYHVSRPLTHIPRPSVSVVVQRCEAGF